MLKFPNKKIRAAVIRDYMKEYKLPRAVCFSCGNASRELKAAGVDVLEISPTGSLNAAKWFTMGEIKNTFPDYFDATSGHLPLECMLRLADAYKAYFGGDLPAEVYLPTGSGETLVCLKMAFPAAKITAVYNLDAATLYESGAPLNKLVALLAEKVVFADKE